MQVMLQKGPVTTVHSQQNSREFLSKKSLNLNTLHICILYNIYVIYIRTP